MKTEHFYLNLNADEKKQILESLRRCIINTLCDMTYHTPYAYNGIVGFDRNLNMMSQLSIIKNKRRNDEMVKMKQAT